MNFPGSELLRSHAAYAGWYYNLLAQTLWNFHDLSAIQVTQTTAQEFLVTMIIHWYGEVRADSTQLAGWQCGKDSNLYHHSIRQCGMCGPPATVDDRKADGRAGFHAVAHRR